METVQYVTIHIPEGEHNGFFGDATYREIVRRLLQQGAPGITVFRAYEGLDANGHLQNIYSDYVQESLPVILEMVIPQTEDFINTLETLLEGHPHCVTVTPATDAKQTDSATLEVNKMSETAVLKIFMKEEDQYHGTSLYYALVLEGGKSKFLWVNVQRALEGFGPERVIRKEKLFHRSLHGPVVVEITGAADAIEEFVYKNHALIESASGPAVIIRGQLVSGML